MCHTNIQVIVDLHRALPLVSGGIISPNILAVLLFALHVDQCIYLQVIHVALCSRWWQGSEAGCTRGEPCSGLIALALTSILCAHMCHLLDLQ